VNWLIVLMKANAPKVRLTQWRFSAPCHHDIGKTIANVAERFTDRDRAAGATVRVGCARATETKLDRDITVRRAAENLDREGRVHAAAAFLQKMRMFDFSAGHAAERRPETHADALLRLLARPLDSRILERKSGGDDGKLRITIEPLQPVRRKKFLRLPVWNLRRAMRVEDRAVEALDQPNASLLRPQPVPKVFAGRSRPP
jgi:hypothetical protein